ncbi:MAG TPA: hypothetical protein VMR33_22505 [Candidatus Baltobacteraceae bacterium]|jgi:hypothetical protein|nr:hypothetical protein [Candidatus Baltobacteraceae bacterium]
MEQKKQPSWYERIFDSLDFADVAKFDELDIKKEPQWVVNTFRELAQQIMPALPFRSMDPVTPRGVGRCLGQQRANLAAIGSRLEKVFAPENLARANAFIEMVEKNKDNPALKAVIEGPLMASVAKAVELLETSLESGERVEGPFNKAALRALKVAWEQPNQSETVAFFRGLAEGLSKPGIVEGPAARATTATPIYQRLFVHRREIEKLKSVRELRVFLSQRGLSDQVLGDPKRLEKICERIGLSFSRRRTKRAK